MAKKRPEKIGDLLSQVRKALSEGRVREVIHAKERKDERKITRPEYEHVLKNGYHEKRKDEFRESYSAWNYAIRGETPDRRDLRVIVSFELVGKNELLLVITVIEVTYGAT